jgi:hypothetical protein
MKRPTLALIVSAALAGACAEPTIPRATAESLQSRVADIRTVVEDGRIFAARQQLENLAGTVVRLLERGELDTTTASEILAAITDVESALALAPDRSPDPTETTTSPPPGEEGDEGNGGGNAYGKDKDKGGGSGDQGHGSDD